MNKPIIFALAVAGTLLSAGAARAGGVQWSVDINLPVPGLVITGAPYYREPVRVYAPVPAYAPAPVYYEPEPVYAPAPVYYQPEPVYVQPPPVYYPRYPQWRHHYRPAPVVVEVPRYRNDWQQVAYPRYHDGRREDRREWRHEERREDRHEDRHDKRHEHHERRD